MVITLCMYYMIYKGNKQGLEKKESGIKKSCTLTTLHSKTAPTEALPGTVAASCLLAPQPTRSFTLLANNRISGPGPRPYMEAPLALLRRRHHHTTPRHVVMSTPLCCHSTSRHTTLKLPCVPLCVQSTASHPLLVAVATVWRRRPRRRALSHQAIASVISLCWIFLYRTFGVLL